MRFAATCLGLAVGMVAVAGPAAADHGGRGALAVSGGASLAGSRAYGTSMSGAGWVLDVELGVAPNWSVSFDVRRHSLRSLPASDDEAELRAHTREAGLTLRHAMFVIDTRRYLGIHAGVGGQRMDMDGHDAVWRPYGRVGVALLQPGSVYHLSDRLELGVAIDVVIARVLRDPVAPAGCDGPCTAATRGPPHDFGVFGTFTVGLR